MSMDLAARYSRIDATQAPKIDTDRIERILFEYYGLIPSSSSRIEMLTGYEDVNYLIIDFESTERTHTYASLHHLDDQRRYVLKISNPIESRIDGLIDDQIRLANQLCAFDIPCASIVRQVDGRYWNWYRIDDDNNQLPVRLMKYRYGRMLEGIGYRPSVYYRFGQLIAQFHSATDRFDSDPYRCHIPFLGLDNIASVRDETEYLYELQLIDADQYRVVQQILYRFDENVMRRKDQFELGFIHSDFNETNILFIDNDKEDNIEISCLLDLGDSHYSCRIFDIAIAILYLMLDNCKNNQIDDDCWNIGRYIIDGYRYKRTITNQYQHIFLCMCTRLCYSLIYGLRTMRINIRGDSEYVMKTQSNGWKMLNVSDTGRLSDDYLLQMLIDYHTDSVCARWSIDQK